MSLTAEKEAQIHQFVEAIDDEGPTGVLKGDPTALARLCAPDLIVNAPNNQVLRLAEVLERMKQHTGLQYSSFERHREATQSKLLSRKITGLHTKQRCEKRFPEI